MLVVILIPLIHFYLNLFVHFIGLQSPFPHVSITREHFFGPLRAQVMVLLYSMFWGTILHHLFEMTMQSLSPKQKRLLQKC